MENIIQEPAPKYNYYTTQEYLNLERAIEDKHEYFDGHIYAMSGAGMPHVQIAANMVLEIGSFLKTKTCDIYFNDLRVTNIERDSYAYPDMVIVCDEKKFEDEKNDTLLNPSVIIEILSPSTRSIDKGRKLFYYQGIPSLKEYFMVDTLKQRIYIVRKQPDGKWVHDTTIESGSIFIETINLHLSLLDIYKGTGI